MKRHRQQQQQQRLDIWTSWSLAIPTRRCKNFGTESWLGSTEAADLAGRSPLPWRAAQTIPISLSRSVWCSKITKSTLPKGKFESTATTCSVRRLEEDNDDERGERGEREREICEGVHTQHHTTQIGRWLNQSNESNYFRFHLHPILVKLPALGWCSTV